MDIPKYIYIDDENNDSIRSIVHGLNDTGKVSIETLDITFGESFESLANDINKGVEERGIKGILIDLCLNGEGANRVNFTAAPIAQHLRSLSSDMKTSCLPIVLCSTDEKLKNTYNADRVSHDLYDYKFVKGNGKKWDKVGIKMKSLAEGYQQLSGSKISAILGLSDEEIDGFDSRIFERFIDEEYFASHEYANFIIKDLFQHPGILINEATLAARLGIYIEKSKGWSKLLRLIGDDIMYRGVFCDGWARFWSHKVNKLFQEISGGISWVSLNAKERVKVLTDYYKLQDIQAAEPLKFASSSYFDTICEFTKKPLDSMEGYEVYESYELKPWQDPKYISFWGISKDNYHEKIIVKKTEMERFKIVRDEIKNETKADK